MNRNPHNDDERTPTDGLPYYCASCHQRFDTTTQHCEETSCELESTSEAQRRAAAIANESTDASTQD